MSKGFAEFPWLQAPWESFVDAASQNRLGHAYLVQAPAGWGKRQLVDAMQALALCLEPEGQSPCGRCRSCLALESGAHPDHRLLTFEVNEKTGKLRNVIVVEQVRRLSESMQMTTTISRRKVAVVSPAEAMNASTANALLKTLEEPAGDAVLFLVSNDARRLPATIRSRCQPLTIRPPKREVTRHWVAQRAGVSDSVADDALAASNGSPLKAVEILSGEGVEAYESLRALLSGLLTRRTNLQAAVGEVVEQDAQQLWAWLSGATAEALRGELSGNRCPWIETPVPIDVRALSDLQFHADRNRRLSESPVRQDFLLQTWLIEWSRLGSNH